MDAVAGSGAFAVPKLSVARISVPMPKNLIVQQQANAVSRPPPPNPPTASSASNGAVEASVKPHDHPSPSQDLSWEKERANELGFFRGEGRYTRATVEDLLQRDAQMRRKDEEKQAQSSQPPHAQRFITPSYAPPPPKTSFITPATASTPSSSSSASSPSSSSASLDAGLLSALTQRLMSLEALTSKQTRALQQRDDQLSALQATLALASSHPSSSSSSPPVSDEVAALRADHARVTSSAAGDGALP